jgi:hypothetical protein
MDSDILNEIDVVNEELQQNSESEYCSQPPDNQPERDYKAFVTELTKVLGENIDSKLIMAIDNSDTNLQKIKTRLDKQQETLESITQSVQLILFLFLVLVFIVIFK